MDHTVWEQNAKWWQTTFTAGADDEYETQMIPLLKQRLVGSHRVLDIGTGEGQVARAVAKSNGCVVGVDRSAAQIAEAFDRSGGVYYARCDASALPFADHSFDAAIMSLVLEHVKHFENAISEAARCLVGDGKFLLFLNHPAFQTPDSGWIDDQILGEQYWRCGPYLVEQTTLENVDAEVAIPFAHRPLSRYVNAMAASGLFIEEMIEPVPSAVADYPDASTIPRLILLCARKIVRAHAL